MEALFTIRPSRPRILFPPLDAFIRLPGSRTNKDGHVSRDERKKLIAKAVVSYIARKTGICIVDDSAAD